jgi:hypothetical protein
MKIWESRNLRKGNVIFTTPAQHVHNTLSYEGGTYTLGPTFM